MPVTGRMRLSSAMGLGEHAFHICQSAYWRQMYWACCTQYCDWALSWAQS
jgi:hypothetical protein